MTSIFAPTAAPTLQHFAQRSTLFAFDYDGTLAPIVSDPARAEMRPQTRHALCRLAQRCLVVVISGRARDDVRRFLTGIPVVEIIGNHGHEMQGAEPAHVRPQVLGWQQQLERSLAGHPELVIENKRYSLTVHYRASADPVAACAQIREAASQLQNARLIGGKFVVNIVPADAPDKGDALLRTYSRLACRLAIYVGDDDTDEDVFALRRPDQILGVRVGSKPDSDAEYFLADQHEIDPLLLRLLELADPSYQA